MSSEVKTGRKKIENSIDKNKIIKKDLPIATSRSLTMNLQSILSNSCFSLSAIPSPFRFLIRFFSNFFIAYIIPDARL